MLVMTNIVGVGYLLLIVKCWQLAIFIYFINLFQKELIAV